MPPGPGHRVSHHVCRFVVCQHVLQLFSKFALAGCGGGRRLSRRCRKGSLFTHQLANIALGGIIYNFKRRLAYFTKNCRILSAGVLSAVVLNKLCMRCSTRVQAECQFFPPAHIMATYFIIVPGPTAKIMFMLMQGYFRFLHENALWQRA